MKKILAVLLLFMLATTVAISESSIDLKSLSAEELTALKEEIEVELNSRLGAIEPWDDHGAAKYLPSLQDAIGRVIVSSMLAYNNDDSFRDQIEGITQEEFDLYCKVLDEWGFSYKSDTATTKYIAVNDQKMKVSLYLIGDLLDISLDL